MAVNYVEKFEPQPENEPVKLEFDTGTLDVSFRDGELNTFGQFQPDGTFKLYALDDEFADRLRDAGFTLEKRDGECYLKVTYS